MADRNKANLGEQMNERNSEGMASEEGMSADNRNNENMESERMVARESEDRSEDSNAGDEGVDETPSRASRKRISRNSRSTTSFEGKGGQKEGNFDNAQGTGYTNDRNGQLQEDGSMSGSQGRHGRSGNRHGSSSGSGASERGRIDSDSNRVGGQTAQNPRGSEDVDRSLM